MLSVEDADLMTMAWVEILDLERVPESAYEALYGAAMRRVNALISDGKKAPDFDANLLASVWKADRDIRDQYTPRTGVVVGSMSGGCSRCLGTGWEFMKKTYPTEVARCRCGKIPGR